MTNTGYGYCCQTSPRVFNRELLDPLPIAELEKIHEIVRQDKDKDRALSVPEKEHPLETKKTKDQRDISYYVTTRKANEFVSKFFKRKMEQ